MDRVCRPETEEKYRSALELYTTTNLSNAEICRRCGVSVSGFARYINTYHRHLMLQRNGIKCTPREASAITLDQRRGQHPQTHAKYREAIEACDSLDYIECNVSEIAREFGLDGTNLANQLRLHYPDVLERREQTRQRFGIDDNLPRGVRPWCVDQYAEAVDLLRSDPYVTLQVAAEMCNVSYQGLKQHLVFYHKDLVDNRINIRKKAVRQKRKGMLTGRGTPHTASPKSDEKYAEALDLFRSTSLSVRKIAKQTGVSIKGLYEYLRTWHRDLICQRKGVAYEESQPVDWTSVRKYNPETAEKYSAAIQRLKEAPTTIAKVASEYGLHPDTFRQYLKEHEPELHVLLGRQKTADGKMVSTKSLEKYKEALHLYETSSESLNSIAARFGFNSSSFGQFIKRNFPDLYARRNPPQTP